MDRRKFLLASGGLLFAGLTQAAWKYLPDSRLVHPCQLGKVSEWQTYPQYTQIWQGINPNKVWDTHVHLVGVGDSSSDTWFNTDMERWWHPQLKMQKAFYMNATCAVTGQVDISTVKHLHQLAEQLPTGFKLMLFAFDWHRDGAGNILKEHSIFHVSNNYAANIAQQHPDRFEWVASIHPYRADAIDALEKAHAQGAKAVKWLPSGMGIDPASAKCDAFYRRIAALGMPIISHTGRESAVPGGDQSFGNPLKMRRALDLGVKVILAHCASDGKDEDTDNGGRHVRSFDLFARMMEQADYQSLLYGDISATTLINHAWVLPELIERQHWHTRLVNGSDYPLPGIMPLTNINTLIANGWLDETHKPFLLSLKNHHQLLYDFALKRLIRINNQGFAKQVFETSTVFERNS